MRCLLLSVLLALCMTYADSITVMSVDLGSQWMKIAIVKPGVPMEIVLNKESKRKTEMAMSLKDGERLFGSSAVSQGVRFPKTTYFYFLDLMAKKSSHPLVQLYKERFPYYDLIENPDTGYVKFNHDAQNNVAFAPEELLAMVLNYSRSLAEDYAEQRVDTCVLTVPTYFSQAERLMVLYAAELAGLKGAQLMDDNAASALNYGVFRRSDINASASYMMFYDMGATSTTASVVAYQVVKVNNVADPQLSVKGVGYDRTLGGLEMELRLREHLIKLFDSKKKTKSDVRKSPRAMAKLLKEASRLKKVLSANADHLARVEGLIDDEDFSAKVTREEFEDLCSDLWPRVFQPINDALASAGITMDLVNQIILVGGGTRVPKVQEILLKESGKRSLGRSLNTDEAPALGASYEAAARSNAFRVKTFHIKFGAVFPIDIEFDRVVKLENGTTSKHVKKTLFQRNNPYPQRKVITFNRFYSDFTFAVNYGDLKFLSKDQSEIFGQRNISTVKLQGVDVAYARHGDGNGTESKGVKAHFRMDESGILNLEEVESLFESNATTVQNGTAESAEDPSTFQKLKDSFSSLFGGGDGGNTEDTSAADTKSEKLESEEAGDKNSKPEAEKTDKDEVTDEKKKGEFSSEKEKEDEETGSKKTSDQPGDKQENEEIVKSNKTVNETKEQGNSTKGLMEKRKTKISVALNHTLSRHDYVENTKAVFNASLAKLKVLAERDALKIATEEAMNNLEAYLYDKQDKLYQEDYEKAMTPSENENYTSTLRQTSDWMFDLEDGTPPEVYRAKLKELKKLLKPWLLRVKERKEFPSLLKDMETIFNYTQHFIAAIDALSEDDQIYSEVEINLVKKALNDTITWKNDTVKQQEALEPTADNILKPDDIKMKIGSLNREVQYLLNKARTAKPKKKTEEKKNNATETVDDKKKNESEAEADSKSEEEQGNSGSEDNVKVDDTEAGETLEEGEKEETGEDGEQTEEDQTLELPPAEDTDADDEKLPPTAETSTEGNEEEDTKKEEL